MEQSETINQLATALAKAQGSFETAAKSKVNTHLSTSYSTLFDIWNVVRGPLSTNGLSVVQWPSLADNVVIVTTQLMHESGEWMRDSMFMPMPPPNAKLQLQQVYGSVVSYAKRYALGALLGVVSEADDDAEATRTTTRAATAITRAAAASPATGGALAAINDTGSQCPYCRAPNLKAHLRTCPSLTAATAAA